MEYDILINENMGVWKNSLKYALTLKLIRQREELRTPSALCVAISVYVHN